MSPKPNRIVATPARASAPAVVDYYLAETPEVPNNPLLPLLVYRRVFRALDLARRFEETFDRHGWPPAWRYGIFPYPHYHSTAHEVIGVYCGNARVRFGHTGGIDLTLEAGDAVVLPAGTGHQALEASPDFHAVGAYPLGQTPDLVRAERDKAAAAIPRIDAVPLPRTDPVFGGCGPLHELW